MSMTQTCVNDTANDPVLERNQIIQQFSKFGKKIIYIKK